MIEVPISTFPGGEVNVRIPESFIDRTESAAKGITIEAHLANSDGIMALMLLDDAICVAFEGIEVYNLDLAYVPYARQDRVCNPGEALSIRVMANMINTLGFNMVRISDPHSDVTPALIDNCVIEELVDCLSPTTFDKQLDPNMYTLVSPDFGATKKVEKLAQEIGYDFKIIQGVKHRDLATGDLTGFGYYGDVNGKNLLIVDDICDGGGTFIGLAKELIAGGANTVSLYVTHGIFSKGTELLLDNGINHIYTTGSILRGEEFSYRRLTVI